MDDERSSSDSLTGEGQPAGLLSHTGAINAAGDVLVFEVWESQEAQAAYPGSTADLRV